MNGISVGSNFRVGRQVGTTIYRDDEEQPCAWVPNDPALASLIVQLLNAVGKLAEPDTPESVAEKARFARDVARSLGEGGISPHE